MIWDMLLAKYLTKYLVLKENLEHRQKFETLPSLCFTDIVRDKKLSNQYIWFDLKVPIMVRDNKNWMQS